MAGVGGEALALKSIQKPSDGFSKSGCALSSAPALRQGQRCQIGGVRHGSCLHRWPCRKLVLAKRILIPDQRQGFHSWIKSAFRTSMGWARIYSHRWSGIRMQTVQEALPDKRHLSDRVLYGASLDPSLIQAECLSCPQRGAREASSMLPPSRTDAASSNDIADALWRAKRFRGTFSMDIYASINQCLVS